MKILWKSNAPWSTSGYGNQTALTVPRIKKLGHDIAIECFFGLEGAAIPWQDEIMCYPTDQTRFGNLLGPEYAAHHGGGDRQNVLVMTLMDVWVMMQAIRNMAGIRFACWTPIDHDPPPPLVLEFLAQSHARIIAMSRFGQHRLQLAGFDPMYVPHMVPTDVFKPLDDKRPVREALKVPPDAFVVGVVGFNQGIPSRKSFDEIFQAFAKFHRRHNDAILYVHTDVYGRNQGYNLIQLAQACNIPSGALATSDQLSIHLGIPQATLADVFGMFSVLLMPSRGEGFGIPLIEAQSCGVPVITTDFTAMTELCGAGWLVDGDKKWDQTQGSWQKSPYVSDIVDALEEAYENADSLRDPARRFALGYDTDHVFDTMWKPVLADLEKPREIAPLRLAA